MCMYVYLYSDKYPQHILFCDKKAKPKIEIEIYRTPSKKKKAKNQSIMNSSQSIIIVKKKSSKLN
jgi:hypothetical protein